MTAANKPATTTKGAGEMRATIERSAVDIERDLQRELLGCPECGRDVQTLPAEGVSAQSLRMCVECGAFFQMDMDSKPRYADEQPASQQPAGKRQHSALPWFLQHEFDHEPTYIVTADDVELIATLDPNESPAQANARLIVRAVNEREELLAVVREAQTLIDCNCGPECKQTCTRSKIDAALHRAEQEGG